MLRMVDKSNARVNVKNAMENMIETMLKRFVVLHASMLSCHMLRSAVLDASKQNCHMLRSVLLGI